MSVQGIGQIVEGLADIAQCIDIILTTQKGSDPFRPNFGVDILSYIGKPINIVQPRLVKEIQDQIGLWETRATITKLNAQFNYDQAQLIISIDWKSSLGNQTNIVNYRI